MRKRALHKYVKGPREKGELTLYKCIEKGERNRDGLMGSEKESWNILKLLTIHIFLNNSEKSRMCTSLKLFDNS